MTWYCSECDTVDHDGCTHCLKCGAELVRKMSVSRTTADAPRPWRVKDAITACVAFLGAYLVIAGYLVPKNPEFALSDTIRFFSLMCLAYALWAPLLYDALTLDRSSDRESRKMPDAIQFAVVAACMLVFTAGIAPFLCSFFAGRGLPVPAAFHNAQPLWHSLIPIPLTVYFVYFCLSRGSRKEAITMVALITALLTFLDQSNFWFHHFVPFAAPSMNLIETLTPGWYILAPLAYYCGHGVAILRRRWISPMVARWILMAVALLFISVAAWSFFYKLISCRQ